MTAHPDRFHIWPRLYLGVLQTSQRSNVTLSKHCIRNNAALTLTIRSWMLRHTVAIAEWMSEHKALNVFTCVYIYITHPTQRETTWIKQLFVWDRFPWNTKCTVHTVLFRDSICTHTLNHAEYHTFSKTNENNVYNYLRFQRILNDSRHFATL